jgi:phosphoribosylamine--glycine ligase
MKPLNIFLIGGGGREHALAWKIAQSTYCNALYAAPGNPGIAAHAQCVSVDVSDAQAVVDFVEKKGIELVVIGPEQPLVDGLADVLRQKGHLVFGPSQAAARLEGSKAFSKAFMRRHSIPTAASVQFTAEQLDEAKTWLSQQKTFPVVLKADGLAAGKGVFICEDREDAQFRLEMMVSDPQFAKASETIVIEEFMRGEEVSVFALCDGERGVLMGNAQDHKRIGDGDTGLNTGGMGAYSPAPILTQELEQQVVDNVLLPTIRGMKAEGNPYIGVLYMGLMITTDGPKVVEYNCRLGDPECQVLMPLIEDDIVPVVVDAAKGDLKVSTLKLREGYACTVAMASKGYPESFQKGFPITGLDQANQLSTVFHSGTRASDGQILTNGGRVLCVTATGSSLNEAIAQAYQGVSSIHFDNAYYRRDIGQKGLDRIQHY